jgi:hypothetical protein
VEPGTFDRARARLAIGSTPLRLAVALAAARAEGKPADALALLPPVADPLARFAFLEPPLLLAIALARADAGDAPGAARACDEILAAAPAYAPGWYCRGRAAQAGKDWKSAAQAYRELLDRWSDADEDNRLWRDAKRRLNEVIRLTREAGAPDGR